MGLKIPKGLQWGIFFKGFKKVSLMGPIKECTTRRKSPFWALSSCMWRPFGPWDNNLFQTGCQRSSNSYMYPTLAYLDLALLRSPPAASQADTPKSAIWVWCHYWFVFVFVHFLCCICITWICPSAPSRILPALMSLKLPVSNHPPPLEPTCGCGRCCGGSPGLSEHPSVLWRWWLRPTLQPSGENQHILLKF